MAAGRHAGGRVGGGGGRGGPQERQRELADDELGETYDGFADHDAFDERKMAQLRNDKFDAYYQTQGVVPQEEWEAMMAPFRAPLPLTFRVNMSGKFRESTRHRLVDELFPAIVKDNPEMKPPSACVGTRTAWRADRRPQRRAEAQRKPARAARVPGPRQRSGRDHQARSGLDDPALLLDVQPHHRVLDMCAAPGSKTFQLLEMLHARAAAANLADDAGNRVPSGVVVANDAALQRANLLTHQTKRSNSPALIVTNHQAQKFPFLREPRSSAGRTDAGGKKKGKEQAPPPHRFDRVLADVPCSGTARCASRRTCGRNGARVRGGPAHAAAGDRDVRLRGC